MEGIVAGVAVGIIVAMVGAIVNYIATIKRDEKQREHEQRVQQERWDREDRLRYHQERLTAYRNMYNAVSPDKLGFVQDERFRIIEVDAATLRKGVDAIRECHSEIQFVNASEEVLKESAKVNREALLLRLQVLRRSKQAGPIDSSTADELLDPVLNAGAEFRVAARKELGIEKFD